MKVKIFSLMDIDNLEKEMNDFMEGKNIMSVHTLKTGTSVDGEFEYSENVMVMYEDD